MLVNSKIRWEDAYAVVEPQINAAGIHLLPFNPAFPIDVRFFLFAERHNIRMNRHDYFELLYAFSGSVVYQIQDRYLTLKEGDLMVIGATQYHRMSQFRQPRLKGALLYFLPELIHSHDLAGDGMEYLTPFLAQDSHFPHVISAGTGIPSQILDLMKHIHGELPATSKRARLSVKTYLKMILVLLVNHYAAYRGTEEGFHRKQRDLDRLHPLFEHVDAHYEDPLTLEEAASLVCMSKSHFMRFFNQVTGSSFITYLNQFRIAKAQVLLTETSKSMAEISQETGFCDQSYFGLVFRKLVHMTPRQYRNQNREEKPA